MLLIKFDSGDDRSGITEVYKRPYPTEELFVVTVTFDMFVQNYIIMFYVCILYTNRNLIHVKKTGLYERTSHVP